MKKFLTNIYERIKEVILRPESFFKKNKDDFGKVSRFLLIILMVHAVTAVIQQAYLIHQLSYLKDYLPTEIIILAQYHLRDYSIITVISTYITNIILYAIITLIIHLSWRVFGGMGRLEDSFKAIVYGSTPYLLLDWVPYISLLALIYSFYLISVGGAFNHNISVLKSFIAVIIMPAAMIMLLLLIMSRYLPFVYNIMIQAGGINESLINESVIYY